MLIRGLTVYERSRLKEKLLFQNRIVLYQKYELLEEARRRFEGKLNQFYSKMKRRYINNEYDVLR